MLSPQTLVFCPEDVLCSVQLAISVSKFGGADSAKDLLRACAEEATLTRTKTLMAGALVPVMRWTDFLSWLRHCRRVQHSGQTA